MASITLAEYRCLMRKERKDARELERKIWMENQRVYCQWVNDDLQARRTTKVRPPVLDMRIVCASASGFTYDCTGHLPHGLHV
jgi:hypothetical protein